MGAKKQEKWVETRERSQEAKSEGREGKDSGEESEGDEEEVAQYKLNLPIIQLQMKERKVGVQHA